jgi:PKD repeat protein
MISLSRTKKWLGATAVVATLALASCSAGQETSDAKTFEIITLGLPDGIAGENYTGVIAADGGNPSYAYSVSVGDLPAGIVMDPASGEFSGVPVSAGSFPITLQVQDSSEPPAVASREAVILVHGPASTLTMHTTSLAGATTNSPYFSGVVASGGVPDLTFRIAMGNLPPGISLNAANGELSGAPTTSGTFSFTVEVSDSASPAAVESVALSIVVTGPLPPMPAFTASRVSGVAPLSVFFDAANIPSPQYTRKFHHVHYSWDFADAGSRRPTATGPVAAHVFEHPGTYIVECAALEPDGTEIDEQLIIQVQNPDDVFHGTNTVCFSNSVDFTGAPAGATQVTTTSFDGAMGYLGTGKRVLFKRGDTFTSSSSVVIDDQGPMLVGAFGVGTNPDIRGIFDNNPRITVTHSNSVINLGSNGDECSDIRIVDLDFVPPASSAGHLVGAGYRVVETLMYRLKAGEFSQMASISDGIPAYYNIAFHDLTTIADCNFWETSHIGAYVASDRTAILGNHWFSNPTGTDEHLIRLPYVKKCVITGNYLRGAAPNKHCIKLHAQTYSGSADISEEVVIADNEIHTTTDWGVSMGTGSASRDERVRDVIVERNRFIAHDDGIVDIYVSCPEVTIRNNVFINDITTVMSHYCSQIAQRGPGPSPADVEIYHNTVFTTNSSMNEFALANLQDHGSGPALIWNNVLYAPNQTSPAIASGPAGQDLRGNLLNVNPLFVNSGSLDFSLQAGSPAIGVGVPAPVLFDYVGQIRSLTLPDAGAFEF